MIIKTLLNQQYCVLCGSSCQQQICQICYLSLHHHNSIDRNRCPRCQIERRPKQLECDNCKENTFVFSRIIAAYDYGYPLERVLHQLKYNNKLEFSTLLSQLFWSRIRRQIAALPDAIIPVPLHPNKHKLRGFNQVHELIREFTNLHPEITAITARRIKETKQQAQLNRAARISNLKNAFVIDANIRNKDVVIIDDVITTGSTANEIAKLCKQLGAHDVQIWCLMRAQH